LEQGYLIKILESVPVRLVTLNILDHCYNRNARLQALGKWRHKQGRGRAILGGNNPDFSGATGIAIRHGSPHVFLPIGNLANAARLGGKDERGRQALGENHFNTMTSERFCDPIGDRTHH
jgi:hypothetical protein